MICDRTGVPSQGTSGVTLLYQTVSKGWTTGGVYVDGFGGVHDQKVSCGQSIVHMPESGEAP